MTASINTSLTPTEDTPEKWSASCSNSEITLHQLSPYIGKLKSIIAADLITQYSKKGDLIVDPFAGAGTIPLEAKKLGRMVFAADRNPYAVLLLQSKLFPPSSLSDALALAEEALSEAASISSVDIDSVPKWVRAFFHPDTLNEALRFAQVCRDRHPFLMSLFLGILHHQRPGFLSYPSSHLVPYLRDKKFPIDKYAEMYEYRPLRPRLISKIKRAYKRTDPRVLQRTESVQIQCNRVQDLVFPKSFDALITSPPYMNALDYVRDNRLRLWFLDPTFLNNEMTSELLPSQKSNFESALTSVAIALKSGLRPGGACVLVVGESVRRKYTSHPAEVAHDIVTRHCPSLTLVSCRADQIPDVRRARRRRIGTKCELVLAYKNSEQQ